MAGIPKRQSCFISSDEDDDYVPGVSKEYSSRSNNNTRSSFRHYSRTVSLRSVSDYATSPRTARMYDARFEMRQPHFLASCAWCRKSLGEDKDIFMYRGDTPFCSEECRQEQIDMDEANEKHRNLSSSMRAGLQKSPNSNKAESYTFRPGTIAAA